MILWGNQKLHSINLKYKKLNWIYATKENNLPYMTKNQIYSIYGAEISSGGKIGDPVFTEIIDSNKGNVISTVSQANNLSRYFNFDCSNLEDSYYSTRIGRKRKL